MEFGYIEVFYKFFFVVFDFFWNRGLKDFFYKRILGFDFGYVIWEILFFGFFSFDFFGNLDVSLFVMVGSMEYFLGWIFIGSSYFKFGGW